MSTKADISCEQVPSLLSSFVDAFVDYSVSGFFLPPLPPPSPLVPHPNIHPPSHYPTPPRLIAVGDIHGDLSKLKHSLHLAHLIDSSGNWSGGSSTLIQVGDIFDRGPHELLSLYFLERLRRQAASHGGAVITLNGNHEILNAEGDFRSAKKDAVEEFATWARWFAVGNSMKSLCGGLEKPEDPFRGVPLVFAKVREEHTAAIRARAAALRPGGPIAKRFLSQNATVAVVGETVFVHGGLMRKHVEYGVERMNREVSGWMRGEGDGKRAPKYAREKDGVLWTRRYSMEDEGLCDCGDLQVALGGIVGATRMVMGHSIQEAGMNVICDGRAVRIDVGMSMGCRNGLVEVLEMDSSSNFRIISANSVRNGRRLAPVCKDDLVGGGGDGHAPVVVEEIAGVKGLQNQVS